jgi:hypothetical protein
MTDFMNLKIKSTQSFECTHNDKMYVCIYMGKCSYIYIYVYAFIMCLLKITVKKESDITNRFCGWAETAAVHFSSLHNTVN